MDPAHVWMMEDPAVATPAAVVDLSTAEDNHAAAQEALGPDGAVLRPHFKAHKTTALLSQQIEQPESRACAQTAWEAVVLAGAGVKDVFVTNQVVDPVSLKQLADAAAMASVTVVVDDPAHIELLGEVVAHHQLELAVAVEIDVGLGRCGVPADSPELSRLTGRILATPGLQFVGIQAYEGHAAGQADPDRRGRLVREAAHLAEAAASVVGGAVGDRPMLVGGGSTGTIQDVVASGTWSEVQAGSYLLMDATYGAFGDLPFRQALFLVTTVVHSSRDRMVVDAGLKSVAIDRGLPQPVTTGLATTRISDEHAVIECHENPPLPVGSRLLLVPGHVDPTLNLHPTLWLGSDDTSPTAVPIDGRRRHEGDPQTFT